MNPDTTYQFVPLNVGKGAKGYGNVRLCAHPVFVVDAGFSLPARAWQAGARRGTVFAPGQDGKITYVYELVLGRKPTDRERIQHINTDTLDLRAKNLRYVNKYDPTIPQIAFTPCPGFVIERLPDYQQAVQGAHESFLAIKQRWKEEHAWSVARSKGSLSKEQVLALLHFYSDKHTDEEIEKRTDVRLGTTMDDCACFLREDLGVKPPSECHIRNILKGEALYVRGHSELYAKVKKLLPTYKSLLVPLPKPSFFKSVQPTK